MNVVFYKFSGEANLVDKTNMLSDSVTLQCNLKENTSIINPSILLNMSAINRNVTTYNYCYIELFGRYYFVDDVIIEANNIIRFNLSVDVLMSYKTFLFGQKALVSRNQYITDYESGGVGGYQIDNRMQFSNKYITNYYNAGFLFDSISGDKSIWFCMTYFSNESFYIPTSTYIDPYGTISHTVLIHTNSVDGSSPLLRNIFGKIVSDYEAFGSFIPSLFIVPFSPDGYDYDFREGNSMDYIKIGKTTIDLTPYKAGGSLANGFGEYVFQIKAYSNIPRRRFNINNIINSYLDYPPYKEFKAYLPFIGMVDIPIEAYSNQLNSFKINLDTIIDFTIGTVTYKLSYDVPQKNFPNNIQEIIFYEESVECLCPISISSSNAESMNRAKDAYIASFTGQAIGSTISGIVGVAAGVVSQNYALAAMSAGSAISSVAANATKMAADLKKLVPSGTVQKASSIYSTFKLDDNSNPPLDCKDFIIVEYTRKPLNNNDDYYRLNGHVCYAIKELSEVYGYTEIGDIHLEIPSILTEESDMLMSLLTGGVIFPDPPNPTT